MPRRNPRPQPTRTLELPTQTRVCPDCGGSLRVAYTTTRVVTTLDGLTRLKLQVRTCRNSHCQRHGIALRPEAEGRFVLPQYEVGLDVIALVGTLRHTQHQSIPEIHAELVRRGVSICVRTVTNLLD